MYGKPLLRCPGEIQVASVTNKLVGFPEQHPRRLAVAMDKFYNSDDLSGALKEFVSLIDEGCKDAYFFAGCIYEEGGGNVAKDLEKALFYYQKAIEEAGTVEAYLGLGKFYYYGMGVKQDYAKAFGYYSIVGEDSDNPIAQLMLGKMYQHGHGVNQDLKKAREYYNKAIAKGVVYAIQNLAFLEAEEGNRLKSLWLRLKAGLIAFNIGRKNMKDVRLRAG